MKKTIEKRTAAAVGLFVLSLLFTGILLAGHQRPNHADKNAPFLQGIAISSLHYFYMDNPVAENVISEQESSLFSLSGDKKQIMNRSLSGIKSDIESTIAVLFKIAIVPCVVSLIFHFEREINIFLREVICDFINQQDGKKRCSRHKINYERGVYHFE